MTEPTAVPEFQGALARLSNEVGGAVDRLMPRLGGLTKREGLAAITSAYPALLDPFLRASGELTAQWYGEQTPAARSLALVGAEKRAVSAKAFLPEVAPLPERSQLAASGRWALTQRNPGLALRGSATRGVFDQSRRTVRDNADREGVKWTRYASANACGFCRMQATRALTVERKGAPGLYGSKASAERNAHTFDMVRGHDHCKCLAVPVRSGGYTPPPYVQDWLDDYDAVARDDSGVLLPEWTIARRMEQRADERMGRPRRKPGRPRKPAAAEAVDEAVAPAARERVQAAQHLTDKTAQRAEAYAQPLRDRVQTAQEYAQRADDIATNAARISGQVKQVTDVADKLLGNSVPVVRNIKQIVDAADTALQQASQVTGGAVQVANAATQVVDHTVDIAHAVKQIADEVGGVLDDAALVALGVRKLLADTGKAVRDSAQGVRGADSVAAFGEQINAAVETATRVHADGLALVDQARGVVDSAQGIVAGVRELPDVLARPIADAQQMANAIKAAVADVEQAGEDAAGVARAVQRLVDAVADWRQAQRTAEVVKPPVFVQSERLDGATELLGAPRAIEAGPRAIGTGPRAIERGGTSEVPALVESPPLKPLDVEVVALPPVPERLAIDWRKVDVDDELEKAFGGKPDPKPVRTRKPKRTLDEVEAELNAAIELDDGDAIDRLVDEMDAIEKREKAAAARNEAAKAKRAVAAAEREAYKEAETRAKWERMSALADDGWDYAEAEAEAFGLSVEDVRKKNFMLDAQRDGHSGNTFTKVLKQSYYSLVEEAYWKAEADTNGFMIARKYTGKVDPTMLWHMSERDARKYMSEEMAQWFDDNGRLTFMAYRQSVLDGTGRWRNAMTPDYNQ
ncbi:head maturation protease [Mycobacterium phage Ekdilam]|uniref:MuF-like minor capsid protein n=1 Tax=Mycobacterium phage Ekdilam TaxID=2599862 RepID=A0A5J6TKT9_9CAUD|nr:head maturation protease [Mycobacterium phage Ekdilam]QFG11431.1 MuF-like minor capsid protein [Mycobacterium phage Ekdilam]